MIEKFIGTGITSPKGGHPTQQNIENNSCTPYVNFGPIIPLEHLWSHVIWTTNNFRELLTWKLENVNRYLKQNAKNRHNQ